MMLNHQKNKDSSGKQIVALHKITDPDSLSMIVEKSSPGSPMRSRLMHPPHITLDGPLADASTQFQQFASDAFGSPQPILVDEAQDQRNSLKRQLGFAGDCL